MKNNPKLLQIKKANKRNKQRKTEKGNNTSK